MNWNDSIIEQFRATGGRVGGMFDGAPMLLLHTAGRRSGAKRVNPLVYLPDGDRWVVFASKGGHAHHPHWFLNLETDPDVTIEVGTETVPVRARVLREGPERDSLYARQVAERPQFGEYAAKTAGKRTIPVVVLERRG